MLLETESNGADVKLAKTTMEVSIISQIYKISFRYAINANNPESNWVPKITFVTYFLIITKFIHQKSSPKKFHTIWQKEKVISLLFAFCRNVKFASRPRVLTGHLGAKQLAESNHSQLCLEWPSFIMLQLWKSRSFSNTELFSSRAI